MLSRVFYEKNGTNDNQPLGKNIFFFYKSPLETLMRTYKGRHTPPTWRHHYSWGKSSATRCWSEPFSNPTVLLFQANDFPSSCTKPYPTMATCTEPR